MCRQNLSISLLHHCHRPCAIYIFYLKTATASYLDFLGLCPPSTHTQCNHSIFTNTNLFTSYPYLVLTLKIYPQLFNRIPLLPWPGCSQLCWTFVQPPRSTSRPSPSFSLHMWPFPPASHAHSLKYSHILMHFPSPHLAFAVFLTHHSLWEISLLLPQRSSKCVWNQKHHQGTC